MERAGLNSVVKKLLPMVVALVAGLLLATGIRGFRAERPTLPKALGRLTTPFVTEAPEPGLPLQLADGETVTLVPGTVEHDLALYLEGGNGAARAFALPAMAGAELDSRHSPASRQLRQLAAIIARHPQTQVELRGHAARDVRDYLLTQGLPGDRIAIPSELDEEAPLQLVVNPEIVAS